jgi:Zn-dependent peptidase ImmA (M78 family)
MDLDDILRMQRLQCTGDVAKAGWVIDQDAVIDAMDYLKIEHTVHIRFMTARYRQGTHRTKVNDAHHLTLDQSRDLESANFTLWHELTHARQAEEFTRETGKPMKMFHREAYKPNGVSGQAYHKNIYEIEANAMAEVMSHRKLLLPT